MERQLAAELEGRDAEAAALFRQANDARARGDHREAAALYARVYARVPSFTHALRREAMSELANGDRSAAVVHLEEAVKQEPSAWNQAALSQVLLDRLHGPPPNELKRQRGLTIAKRAAELAPTDFNVQVALCGAAANNGDGAALGIALERLRAHHSGEAGTHYCASVLAAGEGRYSDAMDELEQARERGLPQNVYDEFSNGLRASTPIYVRAFAPAVAVASVWASLAGLLLFVGHLLSRATLRASYRPADDHGGRARGVDAILRYTYRVVLWLCCGFYYLSLPLLVLVVAVAGFGILYAIVSMGRIPVAFALGVLIFTVATLLTILQSVVVRRRNPAPGLSLDLGKQPELRRLLHAVAIQIDTRPVDSVYVTPFTELAVTERGGLLAQLRGRSERCLVLGIGVLEGMTIASLRSILAHEYGHFSNRDTAGGGLALAVRQSSVAMTLALADSGVARIYNPAWIFINLFHRLFLRVSQGASRLQELLADRWAVSLYGCAAFEGGLKHMIERSVRFPAHIDATAADMSQRRVPLSNVYRYLPTTPPDERKIREAVDALLRAEPRPYDSHPSPMERLERARAMGTPRKPDGLGGFDPAAPAWSLFRHREEFETRLTAVMRELVLARYGVDVAAATGPAPQTL